MAGEKEAAAAAVDEEAAGRASAEGAEDSGEARAAAAEGADSQAETEHVNSEEAAASEAGESLPEQTRKWIAEQKAKEGKASSKTSKADDETPDEDEPPKDGKGDESPGAQYDPGLDKRLVHAAERAGLSPEDVEALGDKAATVLGKVADSWDSVSSTYAELGRKARSGQADEDAGGKPDDGARSTPPDERSTPEFDLSKPFKIDLSGTYTDPDDGEERPLSEMFGGATRDVVIKPVEDAINAMRGMVTTVYRAHAKQVADRLEGELNTFFQGIESDYGDLYGSGAMDALKEGSSQRKAREELVALADEMADGAAAKGHRVEVRELLDRALSVHAKNRQAEIQRRQIAENIKKRSGQRISRPTSRRTAQAGQSPTERAEDTARKELRRLGINVS